MMNHISAKFALHSYFLCSYMGLANWTFGSMQLYNELRCVQSELLGNVVHHGGELLLLVSTLFLLALPKSLVIVKEFLYTRMVLCISHCC